VSGIAYTQNTPLPLSRGDFLKNLTALLNGGGPGERGN